MQDHTCLFCLHKFGGRRRKFCYDCLPTLGDTDSKTYNDTYLALCSACSLHSLKPRSSRLEWVEPPAHLRYGPYLREVRNVCPCGEYTKSALAKYCSSRCIARNARHAGRQRSAPTPKEFRYKPPPVIRTEVVSTAATRRLAKNGRNDISGRDDCKDCGKPTEHWWQNGYRPGSSAIVRCHQCFLTYSASRPSVVAKRGLRPASVPSRTQLVKFAICKCGNEFQRGQGRIAYCSETCRQDAARASDRRGNVRRRGAALGQPYSITDIERRDGSDCHLCGKSINMKLSGMNPKGATIDHLIPISAGGIDCITNVALAHRACNLARGNYGPAQLRLLA